MVPPCALNYGEVLCSPSPCVRVLGKHIGEAAHTMVSVIPQLLLLLLPPFTLIGSAALDFDGSVCCSPRGKNKRKKPTVFPAGAPTVPPDRVPLRKVVSVAQEEMDQLEAGGGAELDRVGGLRREEASHHDRSRATNCFIHLIKVIQLVNLFRASYSLV